MSTVNKMRRTAAVLRAPLVVAALTVPADAAAAPTLRAGYEDGTPSSETAIGFNTCCPHSIGVTTSMPRTGRFALQSHLRYGDPAVTDQR